MSHAKENVERGVVPGERRWRPTVGRVTGRQPATEASGGAGDRATGFSPERNSSADAQQCTPSGTQQRQQGEEIHAAKARADVEASCAPGEDLFILSESSDGERKVRMDAR